MSEHITSDPSTLNGKPCVAGKRLSVEFLLELMASGASQREILDSYPQLTDEGLAAALSYAARSVGADVVWGRKVSA